MSEENQYLQEAAYLAEHFTDMISEREALKKLIAESWVYTEDMAIAELTSVTVSYEGERVQSSNISNPTERVALKLLSGYVEKKQAAMDRLKTQCAEELSFLEWKIKAVLSALEERADASQQSFFQMYYVKHLPFKQIRHLEGEMRKAKIANHRLNEIQNSVVKLIAEELQSISHREVDTVDRLVKEIKENTNGTE